MSSAIATIRRRAAAGLGGAFGKELERPIESIERALGSLSVLGSAIIRLLQYEKRRTGRVDVHRVIEEVASTLHPFLDTRRIEVKVQFDPGAPFLRGTEAGLESVIANLINNSIAALETKDTGKRTIEIRTRVMQSSVSIVVGDDGPGIEGIALREIWLPGETTKPAGTGLGLTIVRDAVRDLGGSIEAVEHGELGGAQFTISLPILGS
jgi:C4-dicarboxylate-specific signal transduction histidine kinase